MKGIINNTNRSQTLKTSSSPSQSQNAEYIRKTTENNIGANWKFGVKSAAKELSTQVNVESYLNHLQKQTNKKKRNKSEK